MLCPYPTQHVYAETLVSKRTSKLEFDFMTTQSIAIGRISAICDCSDAEKEAIRDWMNEDNTKMRKFFPNIPPKVNE